MKKSRAAILAALLASLFTSASAIAAEPLPFYVTAGVGASRLDLDDVSSSLRGFGSFGLSTDDSDIGYRIAGGWRPLPWLGVEAGWMDLGKASFDATTTLPATRINGRFETNAWFIDVMPTYAWDRFAIFAKLGVALWEVKTRATTDVLLGQQVSASSKERGESFKWGLGGSWDFADRWAARLEYEQFEAGDRSSGKADAALLSLSLAYRF